MVNPEQRPIGDTEIKAPFQGLRLRPLYKAPVKEKRREEKKKEKRREEEEKRREEKREEEEREREEKKRREEKRREEKRREEKRRVPAGHLRHISEYSKERVDSHIKSQRTSGTTNGGSGKSPHSPGIYK
ncbi:hypothetical protein DUI87_35024 [Hirundo rustica rustica]|uniref:Uncharacterized protein n=1 Tax=Hirundo rustica rustica TaxID=333673 RepID=A0A3M0IQ89_HIRRU|nr:hypothetical protein DUI87_35024 [Hirundo rustica rustica]